MQNKNRTHQHYALDRSVFLWDIIFQPIKKPTVKVGLTSELLIR